MRIYRKIIQTNCSAGLRCVLERSPLMDMSGSIILTYHIGSKHSVYTVYCYTLNTANARLCTSAIGPAVLAHADRSTKLPYTQSDSTNMRVGRSSGRGGALGGRCSACQRQAGVVLVGRSRSRPAAAHHRTRCEALCFRLGGSECASQRDSAGVHHALAE